MIADCRGAGFSKPEWQLRDNTTTLIFPGLSPLPKRREGVNEGVNEGVKALDFEGVKAESV